ncbi:MAG: DNA-binding protein [Lachnospiraceae bacterium]|nr:DNA-binding protein [Lachnospiraceae bacterium]
MEKIVEHGLLYDFYGELLTAHQRQIYEDAVYHDMSLTEIADIQGISRQGVHDLIRRCDKILEQYEERLGLVKRFALIKEKVQRIDALAKELSEQEMQEARQAVGKAPEIKTIAEHLAAIRTLSGEIMEEL